MTPLPPPTAACPPPRLQFKKNLKLSLQSPVRTAQCCTHILVSREVRVAVLVAAQLLLLGRRHVCSRRRCRHFPLGHIPPPPSRFLPPRAGPPPHRRQASPSGACRKVATAAATSTTPPTVANRAQPPRRACVRPRHTAEKGARARAPSRAASWILPFPHSRLALFPPPSRQFARRGVILGFRGQYFVRPPSPPPPRKRRGGTQRDAPSPPSSFQRRFSRNWPNPSIPDPLQGLESLWNGLAYQCPRRRGTRREVTSWFSGICQVSLILNSENNALTVFTEMITI